MWVLSIFSRLDFALIININIISFIISDIFIHFDKLSYLENFRNYEIHITN